MSNPYRSFPPPSNKDYALTSDGHDPNPTIRYTPQSYTDRVEFAAPLEPIATPRPVTLPKKKASLDGERLANTIPWHNHDLSEYTPESYGPIYTTELAREDFVNNINNGARLEHCSVCNRDHIPPGPPITLPDRDRCGAYLPRWFPRERYHRPWSHYRDLMKNIELLEGFEKDPDALWVMQWHDADNKWASMGRARGGWWKCRSGLDASAAEAACYLCHQTRSRSEWIQEQKNQKRELIERLNNARGWVQDHIKEMKERDKAIALATIRAQLEDTYLAPADTTSQFSVSYGSDEYEEDWRLGPYEGQIPWRSHGKKLSGVVIENSNQSPEPTPFEPDKVAFTISTLRMKENGSESEPDVNLVEKSLVSRPQSPNGAATLSPSGSFLYG